MARRTHRAHVAALIASAAFVACGLSVEGLAPLDAGIEAGAPDAVAEASVAVEAATTEAAPPRPDCHAPLACEAGAPANTCFVESCGDAGAWTDYVLGGGTITATNGACVATTTVKEALAARHAHAAAPAHFAYAFSVAVPAWNDAPFPLVALVFGPGDGDLRRGTIIVEVVNGKLALCRADGDGGIPCTASDIDAPKTAGVYLRLAGEIDRKPTGTRTAVLEVADSPTSCERAVAIDVTDGKFDGAEANAYVGCIGGPCRETWNSAVLDVTPLP
jgi:hypothetical protein